jgi:hypothetical protein
VADAEMTEPRPSIMRRSDSSRAVVLVAGSLVTACNSPPNKPPPSAPLAAELRGPEAFDGIANTADRSRALFLEATRVMLHPRCANCHPAGDSPLQGDEGLVHDPPVARGAEDVGVPALRCDSCHQDRNLELSRVPGAPSWHLAPRSMAWVGHSAGAICAQLKDPARNGKRTLEAIVDHVTHDALVAWVWAPGHGRTPVPGTQARFGALVDGWVKTGAECPLDEPPASAKETAP